MALSTEQQNLAKGNDAPAPATRVRLGYLDGLRGLAALYVVMHHSAYAFYTGSEMPHRLRLLLKPLAYGHFSVDLFIVLSGYCLMLPVARSIDGQLKGGFIGYIRRRGQRILPPYLAALALAAGLDWIASRLPGSEQLNNRFSEITIGAVISHVFLVHNLNTAWIQQIDVPMWSVATEWQIYFVFALLLLPIWRRLGLWPTVVIAFLIGLAPHYLMKHPEPLDQAKYWYIGLFAMGMAGAVINFGASGVGPRRKAPSGKEAAGLRDRLPWMTLSAVFGFSMIAASVAMPGYWTAHPWLIDPWAGIAAACLLIGCTRILAQSTTPHPWLLRMLDAPAIRRLGAFSYSLYLVHYPVIQIVYLVVPMVVHSLSARIIVDIVVGVPLATACAYVFYLVAERPFTRAEAAASTPSR